MRKILLVLVGIAFISCFCLAAETSVSAAETKSFTGKIESITKVMGKPPKWLYAIYKVADDNGEKLTVYMLKATVVTDTSGQDMNEGGKKLGALFLKKGERVEITYSTMENGRNEAASVRRLD